MRDWTFTLLLKISLNVLSSGYDTASISLSINFISTIVASRELFTIAAVEHWWSRRSVACSGTGIVLSALRMPVVSVATAQQLQKSFSRWRPRLWIRAFRSALPLANPTLPRTLPRFLTDSTHFVQLPPLPLFTWLLHYRQETQPGNLPSTSMKLNFIVINALKHACQRYRKNNADHPVVRQNTRETPSLREHKEDASHTPSLHVRMVFPLASHTLGVLLVFQPTDLYCKTVLRSPSA